MVIYVLIIRNFLLSYLYTQQILDGYTALINTINHVGKINFAKGAHPLEEYQQRLDIFIFQFFIFIVVIKSLLLILKKKERILLLGMNLFLFGLVFFAAEIYFNRETVQNRFGSVQHQALNKQINQTSKQQLNSFGFRDHERAPQKREGVFRIVVLGDSFVWGDGIRDQDDIWSHILEKKINEKYGDSVEVLSWGRNGWSTYAELEFLKGPGSDFEFDFLILSFVMNDLHIPKVSMPRRSFIWHKVAWRLSPFKNTTRFLSEQLNQFLYSLPYFKNWGYEAWQRSLYSEDNFRRYKEVIKELNRYLVKNNIQYLVVGVHTVKKSDIKNERGLLAEMFKENNMPYIDLHLEVMNRFGHYDNVKIRKELWANPINSHPARPLSELYADSTLDYLEQNYLLPHTVSSRSSLEGRNEV